MKYAELDAFAKEKARNWYRESALLDEWWKYTYEDAVGCLACLGFDATETKTRRRNNHGAAEVYSSPTIQFSGFYSQGDGASFTGKWEAEKVDMAALKAHAPMDETLHAICAKLSVIALQYPDMTANITRRTGQHSHEMMMSADDVEFGGDWDEEEEEDWTDAMREAEDTLLDLAQDAARWVYKCLEKEYEYQNSDEHVTENIECNEYEFDEYGSIE